MKPRVSEDTEPSRVSYPLQKEAGDGDVFISSKIKFAVQLNKIQKLLETRIDCVRLYASGVSIPRAIALADTIIQCMGNTVKIAAGTTTILAVDEFDSVPVERSLTQIIIRITRIVSI